MKQKIILVSISFILLFACNSNNELSNRFQSDLTIYTIAYNKCDWKKVTDMMYPDLFQIILKPEMINTFTRMTHIGMKMSMHIKKIEKISDVIESKTEKFCRIDYNVIMKLQLTDSLINQENIFKQNLTSLYGANNIQFDAQHHVFTIDSHQSMMAITNKDKEDWKYLELKKDMDYILCQLIPVGVRTVLISN